MTDNLKVEAEKFFWQHQVEITHDNFDYLEDQVDIYLCNLQLEPISFYGMKVLDVGCGPIPGSIGFDGCEMYGIEPLFDDYIKMGYPLPENIFISTAFAEKMRFSNDTFDAVISVNAIDHVDNFEAVALEIKRVLKPDGLFCVHVHYHPPTVAEPQELNDEIFLKNYGWVTGLHRVMESSTKDCGKFTAPDGEKFVLWSNMKEHNG